MCKRYACRTDGGCWVQRLQNQNDCKGKKFEREEENWSGRSVAMAPGLPHCPLAASASLTVEAGCCFLLRPDAV